MVGIRAVSRKGAVGRAPPADGPKKEEDDR